MDITDLFLNTIQNPLIYGTVFLIYVILTVVILPVPVEIGLFNPYISPLILVMILAIGKGVGALIVFELGTLFRRKLKRYHISSRITKKIILMLEDFVKKYGYIGLFIIMSIPLMFDSLTLYFFSLLNPDTDDKKALTREKFVFVNILAGGTRGVIILLVAFIIGIRLV